MLSDDTTHNLAPEVISDHEPKQNESSITFSPRSDPLHHEFAGEIITLSSRNDHEHEDYLNRMTLLCEISISRSQENVHANQSLIIESLPVSPIPVEDSDPVQEEIDIFLVPDDLIPPGVENDDSEDDDNELPNLDHQDNLLSPRPPPEPPDVCLDFKPNTAMNDEDFNQGKIVLSLNVEDAIPSHLVKTKGFSKLKVQKSNSRVQEQDGRVNSYLEVLIGGNPQGECHVNMKKAQGMGIFTLESLLEKAQGVTITDCHAGNPCVHICDPTSQSKYPMIGMNKGWRLKGACKSAQTLEAKGIGACNGRAPMDFTGLS
ncbi:hypothetical protein Tco_0944394 [Tanacetum coccineum]